MIPFSSSLFEIQEKYLKGTCYHRDKKFQGRIILLIRQANNELEGNL
jgi:hypothetical protein